ncbi:MAG: hypothetical protein ACRES4_03290, partial [Nevskiales bacterium]
SEPRDQELEDYLAGKSEVSRLYREAPADVPPPELDAKIRAVARRELAARRPRWMMPLSAAAVLMLSVGVLLRMQQEGVTSIPVEEAATQAPAATFQTPPESAPIVTEPAPDATATPVPRTDAPAAERSRESEAHESEGVVAEPFPAPAPAPARRKTQPQSANEAVSAPSRDASETSMSPPAAAGDAARAERSAPERAPQDWIEHIRRLRAEGRDTEAAAELKTFRERYPDYPLPEDLR